MGSYCRRQRTLSAGAIGAFRHRHEVVAIYPRYNQIPVDYYLARLPAAAAFPPVLPMEPETDIAHPEALASAIAKNSAIIARIAPGACIWFLRSSPSNSDGRLIAELRSDHDVREQANLSGVKVLLIDARGMR